MLTSDIIADARDILLELGVEILSDAKLLRFANYTKDDIAKRVPTRDFIKTATVSFSGGVGTVPSDFVALYSARDSSIVGEGNEFPWYENSQFYNADFDFGLTLDQTQFRVYPATTGTLYLRYYKSIADMTLTPASTPTGVPTYLQELITLGIVYRALRVLQDENRSQYYYDLYEIDLAKKASTISEEEEGAQKGGELFTPLRLI